MVRIIETEVYSRVVGYYRPVQQFNVGKRAEFEERYLIGDYDGKGKEKRSEAQDQGNQGTQDTQQGRTYGAKELSQGDGVE